MIKKLGKIFAPIKLNFLKKFSHIYAFWKANNTYPDEIVINLEDFLSKPRKIKLAIIDDHDFPWKDALQNSGFIVTQYKDYTKPIKQSNQKISTESFASFDIVLCDIHNVGVAMYGAESEGISVLKDIRTKNPLQVIIAYTGDPGVIHKKLGKNIVDDIFVKDWGLEDLLLNIEAAADIFRKPKERWSFIKRRLEYLNIKEEQIDKIRRAYVKNILQAKFLRKRLDIATRDIKSIIISSDRQPDLKAIISNASELVKLAKLLSPLFMESED